MTLNLIKLSVGSQSVETLQAWQRQRIAERRARTVTPELSHITRMVPRRRDELVDGGSIYWVIKGLIQCRQRLIDIEPFTGEDGIHRCHLVLDPELITVEPRPQRAFQGWRYYRPEDAPRDLGDLAEGVEDMPGEMRRELAELGLL